MRLADRASESISVLHLIPNVRQTTAFAGHTSECRDDDGKHLRTGGNLRPPRRSHSVRLCLPEAQFVLAIFYHVAGIWIIRRPAEVVTDL